MTKEKTKENARHKYLFNRFLDVVERAGNKLPHPIVLFGLFALGVVVISGLLHAMGVSAEGELINSKTGEVEHTIVTIKSLFNTNGIVYMMTNAVKNFTGFAPLGTVLVAMLGVGVAEQSGWISSLLRKTVEITPAALITPVVVFLGCMSNVAGDAGYVVLIPIGALMFMAYGRHPMAGLAAAFAGVSGGFSANLLVGTLDPLLSGITNEAIRIVDANYTVQPTGNWFFMCASTFVITILGTIITDKIVEPRLGKFHGGTDTAGFTSSSMSQEESKALKTANIVLVIMVIGMIALLIPQSSFLRNPETGSLVDGSPFMDSIIILIALYFFVPAVVYGKKAGTFKDHRDVCGSMSKSMASMSTYISLVFVSSQFINYFKYTNIGTIIALKGANFFGASGIGPIPLIILFVIFSAFANLFMGSASAKWTILAPVFIPMFMLLGFSPELTQVAYRIGDSCTNVITPLMSQFATIIIFAKRYDDNAGIGTLVATMLPYSLIFLIGWTVLLALWMVLGLPLGPGVSLML